MHLKLPISIVEFLSDISLVVHPRCCGSREMEGRMVRCRQNIYPGSNITSQPKASETSSDEVIRRGR